MSDTVFIPPQNIDAEKAVLGGVLLENKAIIDLPADLKPASFYLPSHGHIFAAILSLWEREAPIDAVTVADEVKARGRAVLLTDLADIHEQGMPRSIEYHARLVLETFRQRQAISLVRDTLHQLEENPQHHDEIMSALTNARVNATPSGAVSIAAVMVESMKKIQHAGEPRAVIPTGYTDLDRQISGLEPSELVIIAGPSSMGKTSAAIDVGVNAAKQGFAVLFISVETTRQKLGIRMLSRETGINSRKFRNAALDDCDYPRLVDAGGKLSGLPIYILDRETSWSRIKQEIRRRKRDGLDVCILDYLTLLDLPSGRHERRDVAVGRVANEAKQLAIQLNIVFILLSQLNRDYSKRGDPEPVITDLRDSGEIEQAADLIIFPFRPVVYDPEFRPRDKAFLKIAKARDLPTGKIPVRFTAEITSFSDWSGND